jgi:hypothetical protein
VGWVLSMSEGHFATRAAIWLALIGYLAGLVADRLTRGRPRGRDCARWFWTLGCGAYLAHVALAFHFFHHWSHADAYADTARQTEALVGWNWGGGIYVNYAFTLLWVADVLWWWGWPLSRGERASWIRWGWEGFFLFMVINAAVVFGHGPVRWFGGLICLAWVVVTLKRKVEL